MKVITTNRLNRFWKNGVLPIKNSLASKLNTSNVVNNLLTTIAGYALDARQGKILDDKITALNSNLKKQYVQSGRATTQNVNGYFREIQITFPKAYKTIPNVVASIISVQTDAITVRLGCSVRDISTTGCKVYVMDPEGNITSQGYTVTWIAVGEIN